MPWLPLYFWDETKAIQLENFRLEIAAGTLAVLYDGARDGSPPIS
ncbi:MAG: hypothetical protein PHY16_05730 [Methylobacter sp.]|nr:hypothetical protein [Methylobacter sp.]